MVPEPVLTREAFPLQRRRVCNAQLHPDVGHDGPWTDCWNRVEKRTSCRGKDQMAGGGGIGGTRAWELAWGTGYLPSSEANLDTLLGLVQWRLVLPVAGSFL